MLRFGSIFKIKPEFKDEYKKAHDEIWPELVKEIKKTGIKNYSIFFRKDGTLFSYFETDLDVKELTKRQKKYLKKDICRKWQECMSQYVIKEGNPEDIPDFEDLEEVFYLN
ncbi:MAG: L-rhamnose mutarotase [Actinobacteria bacterium]|nr:L-rhamnose mutarotase [Actinomycetota bacterium]